MISKVVIRRFKRFDEVTFELPGHIVLAGPNNTGKTTLLQAVAAWGLALNHWKQRNDFNPRNKGYVKAPIARQAFSAVPLRAFDLLWHGRDFNRGTIEVEVHNRDGWQIAMEFIPDSTEQMYVRPKSDADSRALREVELSAVYVPPMTGLSTDEPVYQRPKVDQLLGQGKPGDIIRNLLVEAHRSERAWPVLQKSIDRLFGYEIHPPDDKGADIIAEYSADTGGPRLDIASAGSGFQQVLMLLTFLHTREGAVLLLDEPDAHLHVILQDAIYSELRSVAAEKNSQLIIATHSEVIINSVEPTELCMMLGQPKLLANTEEKRSLIRSLSGLTNTEIMLARDAPGILYAEDYTDINILREWAKRLNHPASDLLTTRLFWKPMVSELRPGASGIKAREHYDALKLVRDDIPGLELVDGDAHPDKQSTPITGSGLQRLRWRRYEIESYLVHPAALERFVEHMVGPGDLSAQARKEMLDYLEQTLTRAFLDDPMKESPLIKIYLEKSKARTEVLPPILNAAGLPNFPYTDYYKIAAVMEPEEIHPEVAEKLDAIMRAFRL
ncbi:MAG: AAA family ATPase [Blastocatellia bacterium]|nr:AAA family ATPase [Blastocatellia bacterium]